VRPAARTHADWEIKKFRDRRSGPQRIDVAHESSQQTLALTSCRHLAHARQHLARYLHILAPVPSNMSSLTSTSSDEFTTVTEGKATVLFPKDQVFYNPVQVFNRDLTVAVIRTFSETLVVTPKQLRKAAWEALLEKSATDGPVATDEEGTSSVIQRKITILEALAASGLRSVRYALEIPCISHIFVNDINPAAIDAIHRNISHNQIPASMMHVSQEDACALMYGRRTHRVDVVDLDPYGTATPFIDAAVQAITSDGLLCVTCTDMAVSAGIGYPEKCYANYGGMPAKQEYTHEVVRVLWNVIYVRR
jgi:tRNA (guanine26-N2/guanine27-N2)-dimethyltransferase